MAEPEELGERDWRRLAQTVQRGQCILLLGPAAAVDPEDAERIPLTTLFSRSLAEKIDDNRGISNRDDLAHVAQVFLSRPTLDRIDLEIAADDFYRPYEGLTTELHEELAALPFTLCVNTTPDAFMATAFGKAGKQPTVEHYNYKRTRAIRFSEPDPEHPIVFNLYGSLRETDSLVLTESDQLDFLVNIISKAPPLPNYITARFSDPETSFLFIGFGFRYWHVRILLHVLQAQRPKVQAKTYFLALEEPSFFADPEKPKTVLFFEQQHYIVFKRLSWEEFACELKRRHTALVGQITYQKMAPAPRADAPLVFLCHGHDDRDAVAQLTEKLQAQGLRVWLDRRNLRGGDMWDQLIKSVLEKVDYVLVVQSPRLSQRVQSYAFKEVRIALERQRSFAAGFRFVVPVSLDGDARLSELADLQTHELASAGAVRALVETIEEDWRRRTAGANAGQLA
jgi:TIR domain/SIR2-like domain